MNKNTFTAVKLSKGEVNVYDFGTVKLHAYKTNDFIDNEVFIVEKAGKAVILESPCLFVQRIPVRRQSFFDRGINKNKSCRIPKLYVTAFLRMG